MNRNVDSLLSSELTMTTKGEAVGGDSEEDDDDDDDDVKSSKKDAKIARMDSLEADFLFPDSYIEDRDLGMEGAPLFKWTV